MRPSIVSAIGSTAIRLACEIVSSCGVFGFPRAYIFDIRTWVNSDDVSVLDPQVVSDNTVDASRAIIKVVVGENNQYSVLALLSLDQDGVPSEEL